MRCELLRLEVQLSGDAPSALCLLDAERDEGAELMVLWIGVKLRRTNDEGGIRTDRILRCGWQASIQFCEIFQIGGQFNFGHFIFYHYLCGLEGQRACVDHLNFYPPASALNKAYKFHVK